jgi:arylsulfatase A-like enzyme
MKKILIYILVPLILTAAVITGYKMLKKSEPDYIFLITLDTTRADFVKYSTGRDNGVTPHLARLAQEGVYFENAYALIPITLPSHASMLYSKSPHTLKIYNNGQPRNLPFPSLAQLLRSKGYYTGAVISLGVLKAEFGLSKGFEDYIENFRPYFWYKNAEEVNRDAFKLIKEKARKKSFFWIHYSDPHEPYYTPLLGGSFTVLLNDSQVFQSKSTEQPLVKLELEIKPGKNILTLKSEPPADAKARLIRIGFYTYQNFSITSEQNPGFMEVTTPKWRRVKVKNKVNCYTQKKESQVVLVNKSNKNLPIKVKFLYRMLERPKSRVRLYRQEVRYMDSRLGRLIAFLKENHIYEKSAFVIMGDHGEGLGEYNRHYGHIHYLHKIYTRVPLIILGPGIKQRGKQDTLVSTLNVAPTILDMANIKKPYFMDGQSVFKPIEPKKLLLETYSPEAYFDSFAIIDYPYQVLFFPGRTEDRIEYVNLVKDIWGTTNIKDFMEDKKIKAELLESVLKISRIITATKGKVGKINERHKEILESLGYL